MLAITEPIAFIIVLTLGTIALVFAGLIWLGIVAVRLAWWGAKLPFRAVKSRPMPRTLMATIQTVQCVNRACRCANPAEARFCRRCGISLEKSSRPVAPQPRRSTIHHSA
jgi:hypothetical protein